MRCYRGQAGDNPYANAWPDYGSGDYSTPLVDDDYEDSTPFFCTWVDVFIHKNSEYFDCNGQLSPAPVGPDSRPTHSTRDCR